MKRLLIIHLVFGAIMISGCAQKNPMMQSLSYEEARKSFFEGDHARAHRISEVLAHQGDPRAQYAIGYLYYHGIGSTSNKALGLAWIKRSAQNGNQKGMEALSLFEPKENKNEIN